MLVYYIDSFVKVKVNNNGRLWFIVILILEILYIYEVCF